MARRQARSAPAPPPPARKAIGDGAGDRQQQEDRGQLDRADQSQRPGARRALVEVPAHRHREHLQAEHGAEAAAREAPHDGIAERGVRVGGGAVMQRRPSYRPPRVRLERSTRAHAPSAVDSAADAPDTAERPSRAEDPHFEESQMPRPARIRRLVGSSRRAGTSGCSPRRSTPAPSSAACRIRPARCCPA